MQLYFVRHGKTKWNLEGRYQGSHGNSPLLPESYEDIKKLAKHLNASGVEFKAIYTSPLKRASDTAINLNKSLQKSSPIITDERLKEFNLGKLEGMKFVDAEKNYPAQIKAFRYHPDRYDPSAFGGENFSELIHRSRSLIEEIAKKYPGEDDKVLIVSHGAALVALIQSLLGTKLADLRSQGGLVNTSLSIVSTNDQGVSFQPVVWNQTDYLQKKLEATDII